MEADGGTSRFVDQCISLRTHDPKCAALNMAAEDPCSCGQDGLSNGTELVRVGGQWDRRNKRYVGPAKKLRVLRVHPGQEHAAKYFAKWLRCKARKDWKDIDRVYSLILTGGRRGGKSRFAIWAVVVFAVAFPRKNAWCISPTIDETEELDRALRETMPRRWYRYLGAPKFEFRLINGSQIRCMSGFKPSKLKRGSVDICLYNEAQNMAHKGFIQLRGAIADVGGLVIAACNPPDTPIGRWVEDAVESAENGKTKAKAFHFNPELNPFINYEALSALADEVDDNTYRREVLGEFVPIGDVVFYAWSDALSTGVPKAEHVDVTETFTKLNFGREFKHIVGTDFQKTPHMAAVLYKVYILEQSIIERMDGQITARARAQAIKTLCQEKNEIILWIVDEFIVSNADEDELIDALEFPSDMARCPCCLGADGYDPLETVVIGDASGEWQDAKRTKGRGSFDWFRDRGWKYIHQPDKEMKKNPEITERVKCGNALLKSRSGKRRLMITPDCEHTRKAMKHWSNKNGSPYRRAEEAHICDAVTYVCWRFFPRRRRKNRSGKKSITTVSRSSKRAARRGW